MEARPIYQLKITLRGTEPPVWRRIQTPGDITLEQLHGILQTVMGWTNSHLHQFRAGKVLYGVPSRELGLDVRNERKVRLQEVLPRPKTRLVYEYDFGDSWEHEVVFEKAVPAAPGGRYPVVLAGERRCPPEDIGGVWGYYNFLEAMADPKHPEHADMQEGWGASFDAEAFDLEAVNARLQGGRRRAQRPACG